MAWIDKLLYGGFRVTETLFNKKPPVSWSVPVPAVSFQMGYDPVPSTVFGQRVRPTDYIWRPTSYARSLYKLRHQPYIERFVGTNIQTTYGWSSGFFGRDSVTSAFPGTISWDPMNTLCEKLRTEVTNFATMLGEYKATASMFEDVGSKLLKSHRLARRGQIVQAVEALGQIIPRKRSKRMSASGMWLQWHFGVETLLQDLGTSVAELQGRVEKPFVLKRSAARRDTVIESTVLFGTLKNGRVRDRETSRLRRVTAIAEIENSALRDLSDHGLTNPPALLWELTTLSWAFDYLIGVGEYLLALDIPLFIKRSSCWETNRRRGHGVLRATGNNGRTDSYIYLQLPKATFNERITSRTVRVLGAVKPQWNPALSSPRIASLLSVLRQRTSK